MGIGAYIKMTDQLILKFPNTKAYFKQDYYVSESNQNRHLISDLFATLSKKILNRIIKILLRIY